MKKKSSVTASDVARLVGVSQSTVSRVFSPPKGSNVKSEVADKVRKVAKEVGYQPNIIAKSLASGKSDIIGLVIGGNSGPFSDSLIRRLIFKLQEIGKQCLVFEEERTNNIDSLINKVVGHRVDGIIIMSATLNENILEYCESNDTPIMALNRKMPEGNISYVACNHIQGGEIVAKYMIENDFKNIAYIYGDERNMQEVEIRYGFEKKITYSESEINYLYKCPYTYDAGMIAGKKLLESKIEVDAIFCTSDMIAIGIIDAIKKYSDLRIPEDISIIGYDNADYTNWYSYNLTSVEQPIDEIAQETVMMISKLIDGGGLYLKKDIDMRMVKRGSVFEK